MAQTNSTGDKIFRAVLLIAAALIPVIVAAIIAMMVSNSLPTIERFGFGFLTGSDWNPALDAYGALPFIYGTVVSSLIALVISAALLVGCDTGGGSGKGVRMGATVEQVEEQLGPPEAVLPNFGREQRIYTGKSGDKYMITFEDGKVVEIH